MPLQLIHEAVPHWFQITDGSTSQIIGRAVIGLERAVGNIQVNLRIQMKDEVVTVQEEVPGTRFPMTCHERHIQSDHNFCIGMQAGEGLATRDHAIVWWGLLERFLRLQRVAERTKRWPPQQEIAHGSAGPHQQAAFEAATKLGLQDDYMRMLEGEQKWFGSAWPKIDERGNLRNLRARCPAGCSRKGRAILRVDCCSPLTVVTLLKEERLRRKKIADFYVFTRATREQCCGTMQSCPLR